MTTLLKTGALSLAALSFAACTTTGNVERNAAYGAAAGAVAGAIIGNNTGNSNAGDGALIGAGVGAIAGGIYGHSKDGKQGTPTTQAPMLDKSTRYFDENTRRYYYFERGTSRTFYENGERRS
ncbi:outer membrane protein [Algimonas ampicilliniresistens]|uniref:Outer membrane protein n=1 Tax=Algimonas ampicilliniresistens TaxID=1298735 RepID=A0ABQ5VAR8_9PROT|nr:glycine zipper domain-containing protein [Algimonas ampicilliniresistens]GLQ24145.1 outer membrane protein [Algimonas ampicilliniresistens]